ncbi:NAD-dependent epimerase/dehydratase family protein [Litorilinea aerophila]|uniref:NAD-dependent epimerase/dehydratase family protein n=1 Tax=Litorilinea aerophila TaxID=1204385 RepID=UPI0014770969|nr:NAD-dependent epimerase/dehydratase family protein [Litorilinea aerophila]MCC9076246.1 NAD-dependent epimerase/dehydratase family protein [Litorilinea aerophila]
MTTCLVTGAAGFVGSHLCEQLIARGHRVIGVDAFIPYYPRPLKEHNLAHLQGAPLFSFHELDLRTADLAPLCREADVIFHLAAMAGLLRSWREFDTYMSCNILATQRLLDAARQEGIEHFIHISTSSVYGRFATGDEESPLAPISPYGITKLAAEHLCQAYAENFGLAVTILRLFSVYGPRQRPDMGYNIFIRKILNDELITIDGDGNDSRSNTFIADCVQGILLAFERRDVSVGQVFNIGGGEEVSVNQVLAILAELSGRQPRITHGPPRPGDQRRTVADIRKAQQLLGYQPTTGIRDGLRAQLAWQRANMHQER